MENVNKNIKGDSPSTESTTEATQSLNPIVEEVQEPMVLGENLDQKAEDVLLASSDDDVNKALQSLDLKTKRVRLSGAARKRMKFFIQKGETADKARELALKGGRPPNKATKRIRSDGSTPDARDTKRAKTTEGSAAPAKGAKPSFSQVLTGVKIGIMHSSYPEVLLKMEELEAIQEAILDKIVEIGKGAAIKPQFHQIHKRPGWLGITCTDKATAEWMKGLQDELQPWSGATLKIVSEAEMPHTEILVAYVPGSQDYTDEKILGLIEAQNEGLNAKSWRILRKTVAGSSLEITLSVDVQSSERLKKLNYKIGYRFGQIQLRPKKGKQEKAQAATDAGASTSKAPSCTTSSCDSAPKGRQESSGALQKVPITGSKGRNPEAHRNPGNPPKSQRPPKSDKEGAKTKPSTA